MSAAGPAIDVHDLMKSFRKRKVIDGLTLRVETGEVCGFLGGNGSGKTTTIRMLCGLLRPDGGGGTCLGLDLLTEAPAIRLPGRLHDAAIQLLRRSDRRGESGVRGAAL